MSDWLSNSDDYRLALAHPARESRHDPFSSVPADFFEISGEEKFAALGRAIGQVTYEFCLARRQTLWSGQCQEVFGLGCNELAGELELWLSRIHPEDRDGVRDEYGKALGRICPFDLQYRVRHRAGHFVWVRDKGVPVTGPHGRLWGMVGTVKDITLSRRRDEELRSAERALESSINGIVLVDLDGRLTYANNSFLHLSGHQCPEDVLGSRVVELWENPRKAMAVFRLLRNNGEWSGHVAARRKDGSRLNVELAAHAVVDREGNPVGYMASFIDITRHREAERERLLTEKKYQLLFSSSSDAMVICDAGSFHVLEVNPAARDQYGYSHEEFSQMDFFQLAEEPEEAMMGLKKALDYGQTNGSLMQHRRKDGSCFEAEMSAVPFRWKNCQLMACFIRDVTERQRLERLKDDLLSAVSHEMRTPLTAILGYTDFMLSHDVEPEMRGEFLDIIRKQSERLRNLVENHLNLQQLRAGIGIGLTRGVEIQPLLHSVVGCFPDLPDKYRLVVDCPDGMGTVLANENQLHRALQNLLSNAVKYSPKGGQITLGAFLEGRRVTLYVRDEGVGIPQDAQEKIFERYCRLSPPEGSAIGGTGLGLALVKEIVKACNGHLRLESAPGRGSTFFISLAVE